MFGYAHPYKVRLVASLIAAIATALLELARPWPTKFIVDYGLGGQATPAWLESLTRVEIIGWSVVAAVIVVVSVAGLSLLTQVIVFGIAQDMVLDLLRDAFAKIQRLSLTFHQRSEIGDLTQRLGADVFAVQSMVTTVGVPAVSAALTLGGMFFFMIRLDPLLSLVTALAVPLLAAVWFAFYRPMNAAYWEQWTRQGAIMAFIQQSLAGIKVIQGFAREAHFQARLETQGREVSEAFRRSLLLGTTYNQAAATVTGILASVLAGIGAMRVIGGHLTLGDLLVFLGYVAAINGPLNGAITAIGTAVSMGPKGQRVLDLIDSTEEVPERPDARKPENFRGEVVFDDVSLTYGGSEEKGPVFEGVCLRAEPGTVTAIIGITGAGKTSLGALLSRFYDPSSGAVRFDGHDLRDLPLRWIRENVSVVLQDSILFPATVADNIAFGHAGLTRKEVVRAAEISLAHDFIERLPDGYDTLVGEGGAVLSGGERQRIALARAIVKDAPVILLDEPTSALDAHTEAQIFERLHEYLHGRTTFIISHRLTTIRGADQIVALENGRVVERGRHETLIRGSGVYARLYRNQNIAAGDELPGSVTG
jgi:ABC-type multidrug transport system fused ATPase/permease subunit